MLEPVHALPRGFPLGTAAGTAALHADLSQENRRNTASTACSDSRPRQCAAKRPPRTSRGNAVGKVWETQGERWTTRSLVSRNTAPLSRRAENALLARP